MIGLKKAGCWLFASVLMAGALSACGDGNDGAGTTDSVGAQSGTLGGQQQQQAPVPSVTPTPTPSPTPTPTPTATPTTGATAPMTVTIPAGSVSLGAASYGENPLVIPVGTTVTWVNNDSLPHTATSTTGVFDTGVIQPGGSGSFTFNTPGNFPYLCTIHPSMTGTIVVQ